METWLVRADIAEQVEDRTCLVEWCSVRRRKPEKHDAAHTAYAQHEWAGLVDIAEQFRKGIVSKARDTHSSAGSTTRITREFKFHEGKGIYSPG
jgi:hypothetical protein